ncbi:MAG TPA: four helix bundle protein [Saprospiraceae bacterium]|nr:four helix bundle protein [Saprospiraceae bacterium]
MESVLREEQESYNELFRHRTKQLALEILKLYRSHCQTDELRIIGKQLIRSVTSVAANYRAVIRARSDAEKHSKLCIVVEEADETVFWLELLTESIIINASLLKPLMDEALEILKVMSAYKKKYKR